MIFKLQLEDKVLGDRILGQWFMNGITKERKTSQGEIILVRKEK